MAWVRQAIGKPGNIRNPKLSGASVIREPSG
jgi:hypothetical protein